MRSVFGSVTVVLCFFTAAPTAYGDGDYKQCKVGDRVQDRDNKLGTVVKIDPSDKAYCFVKKDGDADSHLAPAFMLRLAGTPSAHTVQTGSIKTGRYACYGGRDYTFGGIVIRSASAYTDFQGHPGQYSYDPGSQLITFRSGTYAGTFAKYRHEGEISLSLKPITSSTFFSTVCDLHQ